MFCNFILVVLSTKSKKDTFVCFVLNFIIDLPIYVPSVSGCMLS